jgi:hypothetical protein
VDSAIGARYRQASATSSNATGATVGAAVGLRVGLRVGAARVGLRVGDPGATVGEAVGLPIVGDAVGLLVGEAVGLLVGEAVGLPVGEAVGLLVGEPVGLLVGAAVGLPGVAVGLAVGAAVGTPVGDMVGAMVGLRDCAMAGVGATMLLTMGSSMATLPVSPSRWQIRRRDTLASKVVCGPSSKPAWASWASARCTISSSAGSPVSADTALMSAAMGVAPSARRHTLAAAALSSCTRSDFSSNSRQSPSKSLTMMSARLACGCITLVRGFVAGGYST